MSIDMNADRPFVLLALGTSLDSPGRCLAFLRLGVSHLGGIRAKVGAFIPKI